MARAFKNITEFRAALNGIMTGRGRPNPGAKRNMALEYDGIRFDTVAELLEYKQAVGKTAPAPAPAPERKRRDSGFREEAPRAPRAPRSPFDPSKVTPAQAAGPASWPQWVKVGKLTGGPRAKSYFEEKVGRQASYGELSPLIDALIAEADSTRRVEMFVTFVQSKTKTNGARRNPESNFWAPAYANWTSYPEYAYNEFYRANPAVRRNPAVPRGMSPTMLIGNDGEEWADYAMGRSGVMAPYYPTYNVKHNPRKK